MATVGAVDLMNDGTSNMETLRLAAIPLLVLAGFVLIVGAVAGGRARKLSLGGIDLAPFRTWGGRVFAAITGSLFLLASVALAVVPEITWPTASPSPSFSTGSPTEAPSPASASPQGSPSPSPAPVAVQVPSVVGLSRQEATDVLSAQDLTADVREQETTEAQPGVVFNQDPAGNSTAIAGDVVTVFVALGPYCFDQRATLLAYGGQTTVGTGAADVILAVGEGRVIIEAGSGNDLVCGSPDNDRLEGGEDNDRIEAGAGNDLVYGEDGSTTTADRGDDELRGGAGNDILLGDRGDDLLTGGPGSDTFLGGPGDDVLEDIDPDADASARAGEETGDDDYCPGVGNVFGPFFECERW